MFGSSSSRWDGATELYAALVPQAVQVAYVMCGDRGLAEDAAHDAFIKVVGKRGCREDPMTLRSYFVRSVIHEVRNQHRSKKRRDVRNERYTQATQPLVHTSDQPLGSDLVRALKTLTDKQRAVVALTHILDMSDDQISRVTGFSLTTIRALRHRGMAQLRKVYVHETAA